MIPSSFRKYDFTEWRFIAFQGEKKLRIRSISRSKCVPCSVIVEASGIIDISETDKIWIQHRNGPHSDS